LNFFVVVVVIRSRILIQQYLNWWCGYGRNGTRWIVGHFEVPLLAYYPRGSGHGT